MVRETGSAAFQRRFEGRDVGAEIVRAAAWLEATPPARRELVVVSDFVSGTMDESALRVVPSEVGFRAIPVGTTVPTRTLQTERLLGADAIPREAQETANKKAVEANEAQREADEKAARAAREENDRLLGEHRDAEDRLRKDIEAADRKIADLRRKLNDVKGEKRKNAEAAANEVELRHAKVDQNLQKLRGAAANAWDATKLELESDIAALNQAIDNFEDTL